MVEAWDEKTVFMEALGLAGEERESFLRRSCPDAASRARIDALLYHHAVAGEGPFIRRAPTDDRPLPERIDEFRIIRLIGEGGMGVVYLAEDTVLGRFVALKLLASHLLDSESALARFRQEARSAAMLTHSAIVPVHKLVSDGERHYIVSEFVDGPTLAAIIGEERRRRAGNDRSTDASAWCRRMSECLATIAEALESCHRAGIVHRDVKPSNILLDRERGPRLTDFGIAKRMPDASRGVEPTAIIGSCHYMSPEQASMAVTPVDQRSDVFSLGIVLYEALSLKRPFDGRDVHEVLRAVVASEPTRLRNVDPRVSRELETICLKALEKEPSRRYQTAAHMAADLRCWLAGRPILARPPGVVRQARRWLGRHRRAVGIGFGAVALAVVASLASIVFAARDASAAWLRIEAPIDGCAVFLTPMDDATFEPVPDVNEMGRTPLAPMRLEPGSYRVTLVAPDGQSFAEWSTLLLATGSVNAVTLQAVLPTFDLRTLDGSVVRAAVLRPTDDVFADGMFPVLAGHYHVGSSADPQMRTYARTVQLAPFHMDRREVSNRDYAAFLAATGHPPPQFWLDGTFDAALADRPIVGVTLEDAEAYARWQGKRLPTTFEWEAAARGPDGRRFPWIGEAPVNLRDSAPSESSIRRSRSHDPELLRAEYALGTADVGSPDPFAPDASMQHSFDNVRELTATVVVSSREGIIRGRAWVDDIDDLGLATDVSHPIGTSSMTTGFRCAKSDRPPSLKVASVPSR